MSCSYNNPTVVKASEQFELPSKPNYLILCGIPETTRYTSSEIAATS